MNPDLNVVVVPVVDLVPDPENARKHSARNLDAIAGSLRLFGQRRPLVVHGQVVIAGNGTLEAAKSLGWTHVAITRTPADWSVEQARAYALADNRTAELAAWDDKILADQLVELDAVGWDVAEFGFESLSPPLEPNVPTDDLPALPEQARTRVGDIWLCGLHRVACGDATDPSTIARLMNGATAILLHADPPYGMGKEGEGVLNDNLYGARLDEFQLAWWKACRPHVTSNGSAYIWGNAPDLWRLWYVAGLGSSERLEFRNEIVWDKKAIPGMASNLLTQYPEASERCLFFQFGQQFIGNINADDFPEAWEPLRSYLEGEAQSAGITAKDVKRICGCGMFGHWFTRSQFTLIPEKHYAALKDAYAGRFLRPWSDLKAEWDHVKGNGRTVINGMLEGTRSYFDNGHDVMRDVWEFPRVTGDERQGHATPKPVAMMQRAIQSAAPLGGIVLEPFGGSGSTLMGAEATGRVCYTIELDPRYVDVIVKRWEQHTGQKATLEHG